MLAGRGLSSEHNVRACPVKSADGKTIVGTLDLRDISKLFVESKKKIKLGNSASTKASVPSLGPVEVGALYKLSAGNVFQALPLQNLIFARQRIRVNIKKKATRARLRSRAAVL